MEEELKLIKKIILDIAKKYNIDVDRIILFGSRARGDYRENSDWDILIVTEKRIDKSTEDEFRLEVEDKLVRIGIIPEMIIASKDVYIKYYSRPAYIYYYASKEGVML